MNINSISPYKLNNLQAQKQELATKGSNPVNFSKVQFGKGFSQSTMDFVAKGGVCIAFIAQDLVGVIIPRIYQGFNRNRDITGEYNYAEATEVTIREISTGPPMFIIPAMILWTVNKICGKTSNIPVEFIKGFGEILRDNPKLINSSLTEEEFYKNVMNTVLKDIYPDGVTDAQGKKVVDEFVHDILAMEKSPHKTFMQKMKGESIPDSFEDKLNALREKFIKLKKNNSNLPSDIYSNTKLNIKGETISADFGKLLTYMKNYSDDLIKYSKQNKLTVDSLNKFTQKKVCIRNALIATMLLSVMGFLYKIPDMYQIHETNPASFGLNNDEPTVKKKEGTVCV